MSNDQLVAQIFCRYIDKPLPEHFRPGNGFIASTRFDNTRLNPGPRPCMDISLSIGKQVQVGRDVEENDIAIPHPYVSRKHFVIYSVVYNGDTQPLLYVRDCGSLCGTYIDRPCSPRIRLPPSSGYLLSQSEIIRIQPYWEFHVYLSGMCPRGSILNQIQKNETELEKAGFLINERLLGSGALASVHLAINLKSGRQVACKVHRLTHFRQFQKSSTIIRRILDETNILSRVTHPNLLKFVAAFRSSDMLYTFTELATGGDLFSMRLQHLDGLPEMDTKLIIRQIVEAISYLHQHKIAHRDLKPENVFFATGPTLPARIIVGDLGFAKVAASGRMASEVGTPTYMAPEMCRGQGHGLEVDIWSLGMISLFLVVLDWDNISLLNSFDQDAVDESLSTAFSELYKGSKTLSEDFRNFIRKCLAINSSNRITAEDSKEHPWFLSSGFQLDHQMKEVTKGWKPSSVVHNSVQDLDILVGTEARETRSTVSLEETTRAESDMAEDVDTEVSYYFRDNKPTMNNRQQVVPNPPVIKLTGIYGGSNYYVGI
ncbi:kinase-like domain-containing protein [Xylaria bambusicola]|uniref:kinase-like domain-containing protein n=1 Tax=Xylaria bambusicola TaxID=326684 RepID=UPI002008A772|nr:kinase-like domain-containing protein [Xylaria bambusicola]KAI0512620.1 kinase-like domain-containing protein [Xylaria bambusicola]